MIIENLTATLDESDLYHQVMVARGTEIDPPEYLQQCKECGEMELEHSGGCTIGELYTHLQSLEEHLESIELIGA